jgi:hypothetical protein
MNGAVPLLPLYAFMAWRGKSLPLGSLIVVILFQKYLKAVALGGIQTFRYATGTHSPTHMHHQLLFWHEERKQASENLCSQLRKRFEISFQCFRKAKVPKYAYLLPHFCLLTINNSRADLQKLHLVWYREVCRRLLIGIHTGQNKGYFVTLITCF